MQWQEVAFAPRRGFPRFMGRRSVGCVWYRSADCKWDMIRIGRDLDTGSAAEAFELRSVATGEQQGIYDSAQDIRDIVDVYGDQLMSTSLRQLQASP